MSSPRTSTRSVTPTPSLASLHRSPAPIHPLPSLRSAFAESILDASPASSHRRENHRLRKLIAQLSFGLYLLHSSLSKSETEVIRILQSHINEMDHFLSSTTSDFSLASTDISTRLHHLQLPLTESAGVSKVFDRMLEAPEFRAEMRERNEKVEYVCTRTHRALRQAEKDIHEAMAATDEFARYLLELDDETWSSPALERVFEAMKHNVEMWFRCCVGLQMKASHLHEKLARLTSVIREVERRTGIASRRNHTHNKHSATHVPAAQHQRPNTNKPLPRPPSEALRNSILYSPIARHLSKRSQNPPKRKKRKSRPAPLNLRARTAMAGRVQAEEERGRKVEGERGRGRVVRASSAPSTINGTPCIGGCRDVRERWRTFKTEEGKKKEGKKKKKEAKKKKKDKGKGVEHPQEKFAEPERGNGREQKERIQEKSASQSQEGEWERERIWEGVI